MCVAVVAELHVIARLRNEGGNTLAVTTQSGSMQLIDAGFGTKLPRQCNVCVAVVAELHVIARLRDEGGNTLTVPTQSCSMKLMN